MLHLAKLLLKASACRIVLSWIKLEGNLINLVLKELNKYKFHDTALDHLDHNNDIVNLNSSNAPVKNF